MLLIIFFLLFFNGVAEALDLICTRFLVAKAAASPNTAAAAMHCRLAREVNLSRKPLAWRRANVAATKF